MQALRDIKTSYIRRTLGENYFLGVYSMSIIDVSRESLREKLNRCTEAEVTMFNRMYGSVDKISFEKMEWAERQIDRTLAKKIIIV